MRELTHALLIVLNCRFVDAVSIYVRYESPKEEMSVRIVREISHGFIEETDPDQPSGKIDEKLFLTLISCKLGKSEFFIRETFLILFFLYAFLCPCQIMLYINGIIGHSPLIVIHKWVSQLILTGHCVSLMVFNSSRTLFHPLNVCLLCYFFENCVIAAWSTVPDLTRDNPMLVTTAGAACAFGYTVSTLFFWNKALTLSS